MVDNQIREKLSNLLSDLFSAVGQSAIEHDTDSVAKIVKSIISEDAKKVLKMWDNNPTLVGTVKIEKPLPATSDRSIIAVIVDGSPSLSDVYDLKSFAEVITPDYAFLISTKKFEKDLHKYMKDQPHILKYLTKGTSFLSGTKPIIVMYIDESDRLVMDSEISIGDPFDPIHMWS